MNFKKSYTLIRREYDGDPDYWASRQVNDVRQSAIQQGYRPTGEVSLAGVSGNESVAVLNYTVEVDLAQGAESDQSYEVTHAKVSPGDQAILEAAISADADPDRVDARVASESVEPAEAASAVKAGKPAGDPEPGLSPYKVEPSTDSANLVDPAVVEVSGGDKPSKSESALDDTSGERQGPPSDNPDEQTVFQSELKSTDDTEPSEAPRRTRRSKAQKAADEASEE